MHLCQLSPELAFAVGYFFGNINLSNNVKIAALARNTRQPAFAEAKSLSSLRAWRNFQAHLSLQSRYKQFTAEHCLPRPDLHLMNQIAAFHCEIRMSRQTHAKKKIAA